jgi:hypothetical protein
MLTHYLNSSLTAQDPANGAIRIHTGASQKLEYTVECDDKQFNYNERVTYRDI